MRLISIIRPAPSPDGPYYVVTENDGNVTNVTLGLASISAAIDQAKTDQIAVFAGTLQNISISTVSK